MFIVIGEGISYLQCQITDFIGNAISVIKITTDKLKRLVLKRKRPSNILNGLKIDLKTGVQRRIVEYLDKKIKRAARILRKLSNFFKIKTPRNKSPPSTLPPDENISIQSPRCNGFLHQLFYFHNFDSWKTWYLQRFKDDDKIKYDPEIFIRALIIMCKRKIMNYTELHNWKGRPHRLHFFGQAHRLHFPILMVKHIGDTFHKFLILYFVFVFISSNLSAFISLWKTLSKCLITSTVTQTRSLT